ncbi:SDR family NAD(P)-dependent oxidoreductase, partial [Candidatus Entotheonella palauensis]|uniref:SDR family NAD(P)-dependent oxidoreductase n=1 Tax=Candidatus Entotheonella palauensis TaxID=93172 RepID=UPI00117815A3
MDLELSGKVGLISGGSKGIGKAVAWEFAREGMDVVICSRHQESLEAAARDIARDTGQRIIPITADTTDQRSVAQLVASTLETLGRIDVLVNNAATPGGLVRGALSDAAEEALLDDINTKVVGYLASIMGSATCSLLALKK